jgi:transcriptional regulator with XRE-family HTH domain
LAVGFSPEVEVGTLLRVLREERGLSVRTLATNSGFSASFISQVENGQASPSISSLEKIVGCLGVTLGEFFQRRELRGPAIVRTAQRQRIESEWSKAAIEGLSVNRASKLEPLLITLRAGGTSGKRPHTLFREQFVFVLQGSVALMLDETEHQLCAGDAVTIPAQQPYRLANPTEEPAELLIVSNRTTL